MEDELLFDDDGNLIEAPVVKEEKKEEQVEKNDATDDQADDTSTETTSEETVTADHGDDELNAAVDDEEREAIRERRRQERQQRKQRQRDREDTLRRELAARDTVINQMRQELDAINRRNTGSELAQIQTAKQQAVQAYNHFKEQIRVATEQSNGAAVADATEKLIRIQQKYNELDGIERAYKQRQVAPQPLDPRIANNAQGWMEKNNWYDPSGKDADSRIVLTLDNQLAAEGWDASTPQYWQELDARVKKYLPHRFEKRTVSSTTKSVVTGSGRESTSASKQATSGNGGYKLSAERVQALKDAGIWDNPQARAEAVKRFREYDKQNGNR